jgi:hypothetical protein
MVERFKEQAAIHGCTNAVAAAVTEQERPAAFVVVSDSTKTFDSARPKCRHHRFRVAIAAHDARRTGHPRQQELIMAAAQFVNMFLCALVAGVFWGTWFSLRRSMASISATTFLEVGRIMIHNLGGPMSVLMPADVLNLDRE